MAESFDLVVEPSPDNTGIDLRLTRTDGGETISRTVDFRSLPLSKKQALFDLRTYLRLYVEKGHEEESVARTGVFLAEDILGRDIFLKLWKPESQRSLRVLLPRAQEEGNWLGAALTRIPWEIARPSPSRQTLGERNLLVRVVHDMEEPATKPIDLGKDGSLRVLFVFAEARSSQPLSARRERRQVEQLFESEIYPNRKIVVDFLTHGVTRERLREQIKSRSGYHVVHWSGHGHRNLLELAGFRGTTDRLSGEELVDLFSTAGGFLPQFVFLSACQSGDVQQVKNWQSFLSATRGEEPGTRGGALWNGPPGRDIDIEEQPGYTGIAHALIQGGVPSVVAMRYAVGDEYARNLAIELYRALFAHTDPKSVPAALSLARKELLGSQRPDASRFDAADHATPVLYGAEDPGFFWVEARSPSLDTREPRLHRIAELTIKEHPSFVGRSWQLADLGSSFVGASRSREVRPVAVVTGLGGMGKTALAAETLDLWEQRFEWVLLYQAKPNALGFEATLRDIHLNLYRELGRYHERVKKRPADAIYREADADFKGTERMNRLMTKLVEALRDEPILLVLDNFESNLKPPAESGDSTQEPLWNCQDPDWDACLTLLANELVGSPSRILITCRHQLAALSGDAGAQCLRVRLGPLPAGEAALYLREHIGLSRMLFGRDDAEKDLAERLLKVSRFYPLLMDRLARLATGGPELREQLLAALEAIETTHDATQLPELFAVERGDATELAYLEDALALSIDELIRGASPDARRLLWVIAVANEPVALELLQNVWRGEESSQQQKLRQMRELFDLLPGLPPETQAKLREIPSDFQALLSELQPKIQPQPDIAPLLNHLVSVGLASEEGAGESDRQGLELTCHEMVRERARSWMIQNPRDRAEVTEDAIRLAYADRLESVFQTLRQHDLSIALEAGRRALVYFIQAQAWLRMWSFTSALISSSYDSGAAAILIPHLEVAAKAAPEGQQRCSCLAYLADALRLNNRADDSLPYFDQAARLARMAAESDGDVRQGWADLAWITANWANALGEVGDLESSRARLLESAEASQQAGRPAIHILSCELEALRIDILKGRASEALTQVEQKLSQVESWWRLHEAGEEVPDAPDPAFVARVLVGALDIAHQAHVALEDWEPALRRIESLIELEHELGRTAEEIAASNLNRANILRRLGQFVEARTELEVCLDLFSNDLAMRARALGSLADLFSAQEDSLQAVVQQRRALATSVQLSNPRDRAISHNNLAVFLEKTGSTADRKEAGLHRLASLVYVLSAGLGQNLKTSRHNLMALVRHSHSLGIDLKMPRLTELLADPAFGKLQDWLHDKRVAVGELQIAVDQFLESVREEA